MPIPILLITGFLGAGKTTLVNRMLSEPQGRRLAAIVNDFGAINIDAALLSSVSEDVISLKNGCICCSLTGDLLQTLSMVLRRDPAPNGIIIETSGVSNPAEIVRILLDPVIWKEAALETIICVADARSLTDEPSLLDDALWQSQLVTADFIALSKTDLLSAGERNLVRSRIRSHKADHAIYDVIDGRFPRELQFSADVQRAPMTASAPSDATGPAFQTVSWFQEVIGQHASVLIRAKGFVTFIERPNERILFQLVGTRATMSQAPARTPMGPAVQLVFIARSGMLDEPILTASLAGCCVDRPV
jgi:G3E family GTPase